MMHTTLVPAYGSPPLINIALGLRIQFQRLRFSLVAVVYTSRRLLSN